MQPGTKAKPKAPVSETHMLFLNLSRPYSSLILHPAADLVRLPALPSVQRRLPAGPAGGNEGAERQQHAAEPDPVNQRDSRKP